MSGTRSIWFDTASVPKHRAIAKSTHVDLCVVGAGIAGLSVAYSCAREGKRVIVLERDQIAAGESGRTTAHLVNALDDHYFVLEKSRGLEMSRLAAEAHSAAIDVIEQTIRDEQIQCDFARVDGYLFLGADDTQQLLSDELAAAHRAGLIGVARKQSAPGFASGPALRFPGQGRLHPLKYLAGLASGIERLGGRVYGRSRVESIEGGTPAKVKTTSGVVVSARDVVVCTNGAISDMTTTHVKQAPYRTFVVAFEMKRGAFPDALFWDTPDPYHYVRIQPLDRSRDAVLVGGEDHKTAHEDDATDRFDALEFWARGSWPNLGNRISQWSGQVLEPFDYLAFIGPNPDGAEHVWLATGDSGMGMTHGTIAGILLPVLMEGASHPWAPLFDPKRLTTHPAELKELARESIDVALRYAERVLPGDTGDVADIPRGEGRVIRRGMHKIAAYRDSRGRLH
ncbi:MAG TPA: FAD-dependent oxidoreductase, partial [Gemmatimonadaceae bacterium]